MITSIFLLFVAVGIILASLVYVFGGMLTLIVGLSVVTILVITTRHRAARELPEPLTA